MKYGISSLLGPGLVGALLLGSGCVLLPDDSAEGSETSKEGPPGFPRLGAKLSYGSNTCVLPAGETSVICTEPVLAGEVMQASVDIEWGGLTGGPIVVQPSCISSFADPVDDGSLHQEAWHASLFNKAECELTLDTSTYEGPFTTAKMYYSVVDGLSLDDVYAAINFEHTGGNCRLLTGNLAEDCEQVRAGELTFVYVEVSWGKHEAGSIAVTDDCGGTLTTVLDHGNGQGLDWKLPAEPTTCTLTLEATTAAGDGHVFELNVPLY